MIDMYGERVSYLARTYIERSRRMIVERIRSHLNPEERTAVLDWLETVRLGDCFAD